MPPPDKEDSNCILHTEIIKNIEADTKDIKKILNGNGEIGLCAKVELHDHYIKNQKNKKDGLTTFIVRSIVLILLAYIATKIGLK